MSQNRAIATGQAVKDYNPIRVLQELEAAIGFNDGYVIRLGKNQDAWLYRLLVDTVLFHTGGDNGVKRPSAPKAGPSPVDLANAAMETGRQLVSAELLPVIGAAQQRQGQGFANNLAIGAISQLAAVLVVNLGAKRARDMLAAVALASCPQGGR